MQSDLGSCKTNLQTEIANWTAKNGDLTKQVNDLTSQNTSLTKDADAYKRLRKEHQEEIDRLNATLAEHGTSIDEVQHKMVEGFSALLDSGATITVQNGFLYVDLPEKMLFKEGSSVLSKNSGKALSPLASVLNNYPRVQIYVIGHTDTLTIHNAFFKDNWSLSTERANSVVRILRDIYKVDPARLLAAGRSKYSPIEPNDTKEGRAANRRIQIIIDLNLRAIWFESKMH